MPSTPKWEDTTPLETKAPTWNETAPHPETQPAGPESFIKRYGRDALNVAGDVLHGDPLGLGRTGGDKGMGDELIGARPANVPMTATEAMRLKGLQGATLNHADELAGVLHPATYVDSRDHARALTHEAEKDHPLLSAGAEFAGGMTLPMGGVLKAANAAKSLPFLANLAKMGLLGKVGAAAGRIAGVGVVGAGAGAAIGGLSGEGSSEAISPGELAQDIGHGMRSGALVGGALPAGAQALGEGAHAVGSTVGRLLKPLQDNFETVELATKPIQKGLEGVRLSVPKTMDAMEGAAEKTGQYFHDLKSEISGLYTKFLNEAEGTGNKLDATKTAEQIRARAADILANDRTPSVISDVNKILAHIDAYAPPTPPAVGPKVSPILDASGKAFTTEAPVQAPPKFEMRPREVKALQGGLGELAAPINQPGAKLESGVGVGLAQDAKKAVNENLIDQLPGISDTNEKYSGLMKAMRELGIKDPNIDKFAGENEVKTQVVKRLMDLATGAEKETNAGVASGRKIDNAFSSLGKASPQSAGLKSELQGAAENVDLANRLSHAGARVGHLKGNIVKILGTAGNVGAYYGSKAAPTIGEAAAKAAGSTAAKKSQTADLSSYTYQLPNDQLQALAAGMASHPTLGRDADNLSRAIEDGNDFAKNAALFNLLQKPEGREMLRNSPAQK